MSICETVKVKSKHFEGGFVVINKTDFNEDEHEVFVDGVENSDSEKKPRRKAVATTEE